MNPSHKLLLALSVVALLCVGAFAHHEYSRHHRFDQVAENALAQAEFIGPKAIDHPGQFARYRISVPGIDPAHLVYAFKAESVDPSISVSEQMTELTGTPGEVDLATISGTWRLVGSVTDPRTRRAQLISLEIVVPGPHKTSTTPDKQPDKPAGPSPPATMQTQTQSPPTPAVQPDPAPAPPPPPAVAPAVSRFADFAALVAKWKTSVSSPNFAAECQALAAGAESVVAQINQGKIRAGIEPLKYQVLLAVRTETTKAVGPNLAAWQGFAGEIVTWGNTASARLQTPDDWSEFLKAFASGMRA